MAVLELREVTVRFGGLTAVWNVDMAIEAGEIHGLIGPNGAGKTTTFNVISGLQAPTSGRVILEDRDVTRLTPHRRARLGMGRTFQRLQLFGSMTVRENIEVAASLGNVDSGAAVDETLGRLGLGEFADNLAATIPTGVGRLVELGRVMVQGAKIVLLDEPSSGLSSEETAVVADLLRGIADEGTTILVVEHDVALVMDLCHRIDVLDFGAIIATGDPAQIRSDPAVRDAYLGPMYADGG